MPRPLCRINTCLPALDPELLKLNDCGRSIQYLFNTTSVYGCDPKATRRDIIFDFENCKNLSNKFKYFFKIGKQYYDMEIISLPVILSDLHFTAFTSITPLFGIFGMIAKKSSVVNL